MSKNILSEITMIAKKSSHQEFLIDALNGSKLTFGEFYELSCKLASKLLECDIKKGVKVCILMNNCLEHILVYFSLLYLGAIVVPMNPMAHKNEIKFIIENIKPAAIIYSDATLEICRDLIKKIILPNAIYVRGRKGRDVSIPGVTTISYSDFSKQRSKFQPFSDVNPKDVFSITHTSGTTSFPKGVMHSIDNLFSNAQAFNKLAGIDATNRFYHILPMSYMAGFLNLIISPYMAGSSIVIDKEFNPSSILDFWSNPIKYCVNTMWLIPTILAMLTKVDRDPKARDYCGKQINKIFVGTAPLPAKVKREFENKYDKSVSQSYGLSELLLISLNLGGEGSREDSVGRLIEGANAKIKNDEIFINSEYCMIDYHNKPQKNDDWFPTGDLGFVASNDELVITGRKKDIIIKGGVNISPQAVEKAIDEHPAVNFSVVVGVPDNYYGEVIGVALKLKQGFVMKDIKESIVSFCKENLGSLQQPSYYVDLQEFPHNLIGKIQRSKLQELVSSKVLAKA